MAAQRDLEVHINRRAAYVLAGAIVVFLLAGLAAVGKPFTPDPPCVVGWTDWQTLKVERQYQRELTQLREDLAHLADQLLANPDPVRAEMAASRLAQRHASGLGLLAGQREVVVQAAEVVRDWAAGYTPYEDAVAAVNAAVEILGAEQETSQSEMERTDNGDENDWWTSYGQ